MSKQKQDKQGGGWQFPRPLEIIKCKEGNKEYMKERPARKSYGRIVKVCEFSLEAVAEFGDDDARAVWRLAKRAASGALANIAGASEKRWGQNAPPRNGWKLKRITHFSGRQWKKSLKYSIRLLRAKTIFSRPKTKRNRGTLKSFHRKKKTAI